MKLALYDRLSQELAPVEPRTPGELTAYVCGPTVYQRIHIGNARPFWFGQLLKRFVEQRLARYGEITRAHVVANITDINDKIYVAAEREGRPSAELAADYAQQYRDDTSLLGLGRPDDEPLASEYLTPIIALIERLITAGNAYEAGGDVYFSVDSFESYGALSGQRTDQLIEGTRVEPGEHKRSPLDFTLWKATKPDEDTSWPSPWGDGRPGWHIECSAMAATLLGTGFDVHGGGLDLIFPHHENERAQSEAGGERFARRWVQNGLLRLGGEKMSKSLGNIEPLHVAVERWGAETLCLYFASAKYRAPIDYTDEALEQARASRRRLTEALASADAYAKAGHEGASTVAETARAAGEAFDRALCDDLDTPRGLAALFGLARDLNTLTRAGSESSQAVESAADELRACLDVLGLGAIGGGESRAVPVEVKDLLDRREEARRARDFARSDALRDEIAAHGWAVRDSPSGAELVEMHES